MIKKSLFAVFAMFASASAFAAVPVEGTVASSKLYSGGGDQQSIVKAVFACNDDTFGKADVCIDSDTIVYDKVVAMTMKAKISPRLSVKARTIVMRYSFAPSNLDGASPTHIVNLMRPDDGIWMLTFNREQLILVSCVSRDGGQSWPECRRTVS